jgi:hypothetical protein
MASNEPTELGANDSKLGDKGGLRESVLTFITRANTNKH